MNNFFVDDRGNVAQFYDGDEIVATLNRECGKKGNELKWTNESGNMEIEIFAKKNGYSEEIKHAKLNNSQPPP